MDQTQDVSRREFHRIVRLYGAPDFVKTATADDVCGKLDLPLDAYAYPQRRLYPCDTKAATWTSCAFFLAKKASHSRVDASVIEERLNRFADFHGVRNSIEQLKAAVAKNIPSSDDDLPDDDFAVVYTEGGRTVRRYPMRNAIETVKAAEHLEKWRDELPFETRQAVAAKVLQRAEQTGARLGGRREFIEKQAGHGTGSAESAAAMILDRVNASRKGSGPLTELQVSLLKLGQTIAAHPAWLHTAGTRTKVAAVVDQFDRQHGLHKSEGLPRVEDVLFEITGEKAAAAESGHAATVTGAIYRLVDLAGVRLAGLRETFGDDFAWKMSSDGLRTNPEKLAAALPTLKPEAARMLEKLAKADGVQPISRETAAATQQLSRKYLAALAAEYQDSRQRSS